VTLYIHGVGMACPVGTSAAAACAAVRAGVDRREELRYVDAHNRAIIGSALLELGDDMSGAERWLALAAMALSDLGVGQGGLSLDRAALVMVVPDQRLYSEAGVRLLAAQLSERLGITLDPARVQVVWGQASAGFRALSVASEHLEREDFEACIVCGADSLIHARALRGLVNSRRLLSSTNSDGVTPGEAAAALLLSTRRTGALASVQRPGFGREPATLDNDVPLRAEGMVEAVSTALAEARIEFDEIDFRISDAAGESFEFKEQILLMSRLLRRRKSEFPLWLSAAELGDTGAAGGLCGLVMGVVGLVKGYAPGARAIVCAGDQGGERSAVVLSAI